MNMKTTKEIIYKAMPYGYIATIPKGTPVMPADNLPRGGYWVDEPWQGITEKALYWLTCYGFHIEQDNL